MTLPANTSSRSVPRLLVDSDLSPELELSLTSLFPDRWNPQRLLPLDAMSTSLGLLPTMVALPLTPTELRFLSVVSTEESLATLSYRTALDLLSTRTRTTTTSSVTTDSTTRTNSRTRTTDSSSTATPMLPMELKAESTAALSP